MTISIHKQSNDVLNLYPHRTNAHKGDVMRSFNVNGCGLVSSYTFTRQRKALAPDTSSTFSCRTFIRKVGTFVKLDIG